MENKKNKSSTGMPFELPTFKGYTIDKRLKQFRKVTGHESIEFIEFDSQEGFELLEEMREYFDFLYKDIWNALVAFKSKGLI